VDDARLPVTDDEPVDLAALGAFFRHPPAWFFRERLGLNLDDADEQTPDEEPHGLDGLGMHGLRERLFEQARRAGLDALPTEPDALERARGHLPPPPLGTREYAEAATAVNQILPFYWARIGSSASVSLDFRLDDGTRVMGQVADVADGVMHRLKPGPLRAKQLLPWWLHYLAVVASGRPVALAVTGTQESGTADARQAMLTAERARDHLATAIAWFREGNARPLLFEPYIAEHYLHQRAKTDRQSGEPTAPEDALRSTNGWLANQWQPPHPARDPWLTPLFAAGREPLGAEPGDTTLVALAEAVLAPMQAHLQPLEASS
jgi:exodeoxyribonuclease V gamma subunit